MKNLVDVINNNNNNTKVDEAMNRGDVHILVESTGATQANAEYIDTLMSTFKGAKLYYFDMKADQVYQVRSSKDIPFSGGHASNYDIVHDFYKEFMGETIIFITC